MTDTKGTLALEAPLQPRWDSVATAENAAALSTLEDAANALWIVRNHLLRVQTYGRNLAESRARHDGPGIPDKEAFDLRGELSDFLHEADDELLAAGSTLPLFFPAGLDNAALKSPLFPFHEQITLLRNAIIEAQQTVNLMMEPEGQPYGMTMEKMGEAMIPNMQGGFDKMPVPLVQFQVNVDLEYRIASVRAAVNAAMNVLESVETVFEPYDMQGHDDEDSCLFDDTAQPALP